MLSVSDAQLDAMRAQQWRAVQTRIAEHLNAAFSDQLIQKELEGNAVHPPLKSALARAHKLGFETERDLRIFAEACAETDFEFPDSAHSPDLIIQIKEAKDSSEKARTVEEFLIVRELAETANAPS